MELNKLTKQELIDALNQSNEALQISLKERSELISDLRLIYEVVSKFKAENPLPDKVNIFWILSRSKAIYDLIKALFKIVKERQY